VATWDNCFPALVSNACCSFDPNCYWIPEVSLHIQCCHKVQLKQKCYLVKLSWVNRQSITFLALVGLNRSKLPLAYLRDSWLDAGPNQIQDSNNNPAIWSENRKCSNLVVQTFTRQNFYVKHFSYLRSSRCLWRFRHDSLDLRVLNLATMTI
jgi:hypothetical protein